MVGLQTFPRWVRAALASDFYVDVDIVNAHPSILFSVIKILLPTTKECWKNLFYYCKNRHKVLDTISYFLGNGPIKESPEARKLAKLCITSLFFGSAIPNGGGYNITFKYIQNQFNLDKLVEEIHATGKQLFALAREKKLEISQDNSSESGSPKAKQAILQSLERTYNMLAPDLDQKQGLQEPLHSQKRQATATQE